MLKKMDQGKCMIKIYKHVELGTVAEQIFHKFYVFVVRKILFQ